MSISGRVKLALGTLIAMLIAYAGIGLYLDRTVQSRVESVVRQNFAAAEALAEISVLGHKLRRFEKEYFIYINDAGGRERYRREWTVAQNQLQKALDAMRANENRIYLTADVDSFTRWNSALQYYTSEFRTIMERGDAGLILPPSSENADVPAGARKGAASTGSTPTLPDPAAAIRIANQMIGPGKDRFRELLDGADALRKEKLSQSVVAAGEVRTLFRQSQYVSMLLLAISLMIALYQMLAIPRAIRRPIEGFVDLAVRISKGDVSQGKPSQQMEEFQPLAQALERLRVAQMGLLERARNRSK